MQGNFIKSLTSKQEKIIPDTPVYEKEKDDIKVEEYSYIIEQERIKQLSLDNYFIKGNNGKTKFYLNGEWNLNEVKFQVISTAGGMLEVQHAGKNRYSFRIENLDVDFYYKKSKIVGKITINNSENFYLKKYNGVVNFFNAYNTRVAYGNYFKSEPSKKNNNLINYYRLVYNKEYYKYRQIYLIIYIIFLQIIKFESIESSNMLLN